MSGVTFRLCHIGDWTGVKDEQLILHSLHDLIRLLDLYRCPIILNRLANQSLSLEVVDE